MMCPCFCWCAAAAAAAAAANVMQSENMTSNAEIRDKYQSVEDFEDDFM
jgi:hypothetical protein